MATAGALLLIMLSWDVLGTTGNYCTWLQAVTKRRCNDDSYRIDKFKVGHTGMDQLAQLFNTHKSKQLIPVETAVVGHA